MNILEQVKEDNNMSAVITIKISESDKQELIEFCGDRSIGISKLVRNGVKLIIKEIKKEESR